MHSGDHASVLVLYEEATDSLILTQRSQQLKYHPGEICFPGGRWQPGDADYYMTAVRELYEELGITQDRLLDPSMMETELTLTGFIIHPWFAKIITLDPYLPYSKEVEEVFRTPFQQARNPKNYETILVERGGYSFKSCQYTGDSHYIWGATARVMKQLCDVG